MKKADWIGIRIHNSEFCTAKAFREWIKNADKENLITVIDRIDDKPVWGLYVEGELITTSFNKKSLMPIAERLAL